MSVGNTSSNHLFSLDMLVVRGITAGTHFHLVKFARDLKHELFTSILPYFFGNFRLVNYYHLARIMEGGWFFWMIFLFSIWVIF